MNALIDLENCREYMTITLGGRDHRVKLAGTLKNPYFCGKDVCGILDHKNSKHALQTHVPLKYKKDLSYFYGENIPSFLIRFLFFKLQLKLKKWLSLCCGRTSLTT